MRKKKSGIFKQEQRVPCVGGVQQDGALCSFPRPRAEHRSEENEQRLMRYRSREQVEMRNERVRVSKSSDSRRAKVELEPTPRLRQPTVTRLQDY